MHRFYWYSLQIFKHVVIICLDGRVNTTIWDLEEIINVKNDELKSTKLKINEIVTKLTTAGTKIAL